MKAAATAEVKYTGTVQESDDRFMSIYIDPTDVVAPDAGHENVLAAWYSPTASGERPYVHQPLSYPALPDAVLNNLNALCDHCGHIIHRQTFFVFRNLATGGWTHVSAGCLPDYLGSAVVAAEIIKWTALYDAFVDTIRESMPIVPGAGRQHFGVEEVVRTAVEVIALRGWVSRGQARETGEWSTAALVLDVLEYGDKGTPQTQELVREMAENPPNDPFLASDVVAWMRKLHNEDVKGRQLTDYLHNLASVGSRQFVESRSVGLLVSAPGAYADWMKAEAREANKPPIDPGKHYGSVIGDRVEADVHVDEIEERGENEYGTSILVHMHVVPTGERLSWWTGESLKLDEGKQYHVRMTIKKHGEWDGYNITTVNRVQEYNGPKPRKKKGETPD
jgi:hypothetical protein